jgi:hypothetical protein
VFSVEGGVLQEASTLGGRSLLPEREWDRKIHFPRLSDDKSRVVFELKLNPPVPEDKGFRLVSGELEYSTTSGQKHIDMGIVAVKAGEKFSKHNATVKSYGPSKWNKEKYTMELSLQYSRKSVKKLQFFAEDGTPINSKINGYSEFNGKATINVTFDNNLPERVRCSAELSTGIKKLKTKFSLENIDFLGNSLSE